MAPFEGEARLISAMTASDVPRSAATNDGGAGRAPACSRSADSVGARISARRWAASVSRPSVPVAGVQPVL